MSLLPPSGLPWDYNEPPGKAFSDGSLGLTIGCISFCLGLLGHPVQPIFDKGKIGIGEWLVRLEKLSVDGGDPVIRVLSVSSRDCSRGKSSSSGDFSSALALVSSASVGEGPGTASPVCARASPSPPLSPKKHPHIKSPIIE